MRFNCGPSKEEKRERKKQKWKDKCTRWLNDFAIFPTRTIDGPCVWLERIEVHIIPFHSSGSSPCDVLVTRLKGSNKELSKDHQKYLKDLFG